MSEEQKVDLTPIILEKLKSGACHKELQAQFKKFLDEDLASPEGKKTLSKIYQEVSTSQSYLEVLAKNMILGSAIQKAADETVEKKTTKAIEDRLPKELAKAIDAAFEPLKAKLTKRLYEMVPKAIKDSSQDIKDLTTTYIDSYVKTILPDVVHSYMARSFETFIKNHTEMAQILARHSENLNTQLASNASAVLYNVCSDPAYHQITTAYVEESKRRCEEETARLSNYVNAQSARYDDLFRERLNSYDSKIKKALADLDKTSMEKDINDLRRELNALKSLQEKTDTATGSLRQLLEAAVFRIDFMTLAGIAGSVVAIALYLSLPTFTPTVVNMSPHNIKYV